MTPAQYADALIRAVNTCDGGQLKQLLSLSAFSKRAEPTDGVLSYLGDGRPQRIQSALLKCNGFLASPWTEIATNHLVVAARLAMLPSVRSASTFNGTARGFGLDAAVDGAGRTGRELVKEAWEAMNALVSAFLRFFGSLQHGRWCNATLVMLLSHHRQLSVLADNVEPPSASSTSATQRHLEECARQLNKAFSACVADHSTEVEHSRKWATYEVVGLVFRGYFNLKSLGLCRNILRALSAADLPDFELFPRAQRVTFKYYLGVLAFLNEEYVKAESELSYAFAHCHARAYHNQEMILQYLIPCRLLRGTLPSMRLMTFFPRLANLYDSFIFAIRTSDVRSYDRSLALSTVERALVQNGTYLAIERAREICLRGLLKRVYRCKDRNSRIALQDFHCALRFVGVESELLETEWLVATQIAKGYLRGYISHSHMMAVLASSNPFPALQTVPIV